MPGKKGYGFNENAIQARVRILLWLGVQAHKGDFITGIPKGYKLTNKVRHPNYEQEISFFKYLYNSKNKRKNCKNVSKIYSHI